jgi:CRP/FNR family transcriptional regulator, cyclic AMP receptor protein
MNIIERVLLLQNIELFNEVTTEQLSFIAAIGKEKEVASGKMLYRENDEADGLYVVISGAVAAKRGDDVIEQIGPNGSFGIWAFFDDQPRLTDAIAVEPSTLLFVSREDFYDVLADHVDIVQNIMKQLVQRLRRLTSEVEQQT